MRVKKKSATIHFYSTLQELPGVLSERYVGRNLSASQLRVKSGRGDVAGVNNTDTPWKRMVRTWTVSVGQNLGEVRATHYVYR